jgi:hypothetical protein
MEPGIASQYILGPGDPELTTRTVGGGIPEGTARDEVESARVNRRTESVRCRPSKMPGVTTSSPWMFAAPPIIQAVCASRTAFSRRFASAAVEDVAS